MTDRPILFSGPMVRALLAGTKTQTRRLLKFQPAPGISIIRKTIRPLDADPYHAFERRSVYGNYAGELEIRIKRGDRLWVRENAAVRHTSWHHADGASHTVSYRADEDDSGIWLGLPTVGGGPRKGEAPSVFPSRSHNVDGSLRWQPSIHMPKWASRLTLTVTDVRVERLQDISDADAIAEGIERSDRFPDMFMTPAGDYAKPVVAYQRLWESINGLGSWDVNPWIVAYTFTVHRQNIDTMSKEAA